MPKEWEASHIEIDPELTERLAQRAVQSSDLDIWEAGEDYLPKIRS